MINYEAALCSWQSNSMTCYFTGTFNHGSETEIREFRQIKCKSTNKRITSTLKDKHNVNEVDSWLTVKQAYI